MKRLRQKPVEAFDIETTGLSVWRGSEIFSYCRGAEDGAVDVYLHSSSKRGDRDRLQHFFSDTTVGKVCHNYKFELTHLLNEGYFIPESTEWHDTMLMSQLLRNLAPGHGLDELAYELCGYTKEYDEELNRWKKTTNNRYDKIPFEVIRNYQVADGQRGMLLYKIFYPEISANEALYRDYQNELALVKTTIRLEQYGIKVDVESSNKLLLWLQAEHEKTVHEVFTEYGEYINLGSDKQLCGLLFERLQYPILSKTDNGNPSTDKEALMELHELFPNDKIFHLAIKWRSYTTGQAMVKSYLELMDERTHILHPTINTNRARTGRESSNDPNLQNVSKTEALKNLYPVPARRCFCNRKHHFQLLADYAGIEMRLIILRSKCKAMMQLLRTGGDPHHVAACIFWSTLYTDRDQCVVWYLEKYPEHRKAYLKIRSEEGIDAAKEYIYKRGKKVLRGAAKNANFAMAYGAGAAKLTQVLEGKTIAEIRKSLVEYTDRFPEIVHFTRTIGKQIKKVGYTVTPFGRPLYVSHDKAFSASNYDIQGTAAGILKRAQVRTDHYLLNELNDEIRIVLPIHDEIIFSVPEYFTDRIVPVVNKLSTLMTTMEEIDVPLEVEWKITNGRWNEARPFDPETYGKILILVS